MPRNEQDRPGAIGGYWLSRRPNSDQWCRTWFDRNTRQTSRASLGVTPRECAFAEDTIGRRSANLDQDRVEDDRVTERGVHDLRPCTFPGTLRPHKHVDLC